MQRAMGKGSQPEARLDNGTGRPKAELARRVRGVGGARLAGNGLLGTSRQDLGAGIPGVQVTSWGGGLGTAGKGAEVPPPAGEATVGQPGSWVW